jgi:hypothetical protein
MPYAMIVHSGATICCPASVATCFKNSAVSKRLARSSSQQHPLRAMPANANCCWIEPGPAVTRRLRVEGRRADPDGCHSGICTTKMISHGNLETGGGREQL